MISSREKNFISVILYIHNEEKYLEYFLNEIYNVLNNNFEKFEIICVNDCSTDGSIQKIKSFASCCTDALLSLINMSLYQGIELSMNAGVDLAIGDFVLEFDSLFIDYSINIIMDVYYQSLKGYDIVAASPEIIQRGSSKFFYKVFNSNSNISYNLRTDSFRILSRRAINRVHAIRKTIPYRKAIYADSGLKIDTVLYKPTKNKIIEDSKRVRHARKSIAIDSLILFTDIAYKISSSLALFMMVLTVFVSGYTLLVYFGQNKPIPGWTTIMLFLSISFFGVFIILAIIIKYITILVDLVFKKQSYLMESIEKITTR